MSLSLEESNFLRFYFLNLKIASKAVRKYFDHVHPPTQLTKDLARSFVTLKGLRFITNSQLKILYPSPAVNVRSEDFDTTLMVCLLRNMTPCESAPVTRWDNLPLPADTCRGADLARVKWYRNIFAHNKDGKLSPTEFNQCWADLEGAILRFGGPSLLKESQSAQHIVLDTSLIDMLNTVRNCEKHVQGLQMSQENNTRMINDLETKLTKQWSVKEKHEHEIQQLQNSLQQGKTKVQNLAFKLSYTNRSIAKSIENIEARTKRKEKNEEKIEDLQEQSVNKQNQIDRLEVKYEQHDKLLKEHGEHLAKYDGQLAKHDEHMVKDDIRKRELDEQMAKHKNKIKENDEQIASCIKDIDDIKKKQHNTDDSSNESKRKRLEDDTKALIQEDLREGTFVITKAVKDGLLLLKQNGVLLITGHAGTGKSRISRHILHMFCTENTSYKCIRLNKLQEWEDILSTEDSVIVLLDDIFGETNCIYDRETDTPILDKVHTYVCKGNIKVMITIRDTVKRQCQEVFDSHRLFKFDICDLSSDKYKLCEKEKQDILTIYMKKVRQSDLVDFKGFVNRNGIAILELVEIFKITKENPVKGFPLVVYQFVHNDKYFQLGSKFFDRPTETILDEINEIRRQGEMHKKCMIQYGVMVYSAIHENGIDPDDNSSVTEVVKIIDAIYGETIRMKRCQISDAVMELKGSYLVKIPNQRSYKCHHPTLQESVILSFAQIDDETMNKIIPLLNWTFFLKMVKPNAYKEKEGEVVLRIPTTSYKLLAHTLVDIYMSEFTIMAYYFLDSLSNTEIFQQADCVLLTYLLDVVEKTYQKDIHTVNMIRSNDINYYNHLLYMKTKDVFPAVLLVILATKERLFEMFQFTLQRIKQIIRTEDNCFTNNYIKAALITCIYQISSSKDARIVEHVKALLDIVEESKIPVLLDQNISLTNIILPNIRFSMCDYYDSDTTCVFLPLCIVNAYLQFNIPLLEYLLSRYNETQFDVNLFLKVFYSEVQETRVSSLSHKSLKWMIKRFEDQKFIDIYSILRSACEYQMLDTVEYLASKCETFGTFDAISCLKRFLGLNYCKIPRRVNPSYLLRCNKDTLNFLVSKIDDSKIDLTYFVKLVLQEDNIPDYVFDAFLPVCLNNKEILTLACKNAHLYVVKQIMEKSQNVDIQSALSACITIPDYNGRVMDVYGSYKMHVMEERQLKIMKYIIEKFGYEQFDLKAVCQLAYQSKKYKFIEWFVQNIDLTLLYVDFIRNSLLEEGELEILEFTMNKTELTNLEKNKILKTVIKRYTSKCSIKILDIVSTVWESTEDKEELKMEEIVIAAYEGNCFNLLLWIYEHCNSYISSEARNCLMLACKDGRVEVGKWLLQAFELKSFDIHGAKLFISEYYKILRFDNRENEVDELMSKVNWILKHFQIKSSDLKSGLFRFVSLSRDEMDGIMMYSLNFNEFPDLLLSILEKCFHCLSTEDLEELMEKSLNLSFYVLVNWILENDRLCSFDKQKILNKACVDAEFETIKLVSKYFSSLDMTYAIIACISYSGINRIMYNSFDSIIACLDLLWEETDHTSIDIFRIVNLVCNEDYVRDEIVTWILQNFPHDRIPIKKVLILCCKQRKFYHVKYIFHEVDNKQLYIKEAFSHACRRTSSGYASNIDVLLVDFLFQRLHDKTSSLYLLLNELLNENSYDLILYFLKKGYYRREINMTYLMNRACRLGHVKLVQWLLANDQHTKLDVKSAFHEASYCEDDKMQLQCVAILWHYVQDINMFDIDIVLKRIDNSSRFYKTFKYDRLLNWIMYLKKINRRTKSETSKLNSAEYVTVQSQQDHDDQQSRQKKKCIIS